MDDQEADALIRAPSESLTMELKAWLDMEQLDCRAKLVRAFLALRNYNGGYVLIGFDDTTGEPVHGAPADPRVVFHFDILQALLSTYASDTFSIEVKYPLRDGVFHPVIHIPAGVQIPVAVKKDLVRDGSKALLRKGEVMFRTLTANNSVSSTVAQPSDWRSIMDICFNNREADLAGFIRRHLVDTNISNLITKFAALDSTIGQDGLEDKCRTFANYCEGRAGQLEQTRGLAPLPEAFGWMEVAAVTEPPATSYVADYKFLDRLMLSRPTYANDLWLDSRSFSHSKQRPASIVGGWEALIDLTDWWELREYWLLETTGKFFLRRPLAEDASARSRNGAAGAILDLNTTITTVAEAILKTLAFARAVETESGLGRVGILFRYRGLEERRLTSLNGGVDLIAFERRSSVDVYEKFVEVSTDTAPVNLGPVVWTIIRELFALFNGYSVNQSSVEQRVRAFVDHR